MPRRLFTFLSALSLLLCAAIVVLWVRSYSAGDCWGRQTDGVIEFVRSDHGRVSYTYTSGHPLPREGLGPAWAPGACEPEEARFHPGGAGLPGALGFGREEDTQFIAPAGVAPPGGHFTPLTADVVEWWLPHWFPAAVAAALPVGRLAMSWRRRRRRRQRPRRGLCPSCGYNLSGNLSGTCPECGEPIAKVPDDPPAVVRARRWCCGCGRPTARTRRHRRKSFPISHRRFSRWGYPAGAVTGPAPGRMPLSRAGRGADI
jgi:hypothetical protein